ncbi:MAG: acyl-CoA dehydrogenase family protein [Hellea sp.]
MQFAFTDEQNLIRESVGTACEQLCDREDLFKSMEDNDGFHAEAWQTLCAEMGLGLTAVPEARGGLGLGTIELASIMEKMGRTLLPTPFFTSIILSATALIHGKKTETFNGILEEVGGGEKVASFAFLDRQGQNSSASGQAVYREGSLSGDFGFVQYGSLADNFIVLAQDGSGAPCLAVIDAKADGVHIAPRVSMDMTRPMSDLSLKDVSIIGGELLTQSSDTIERVFNIARICLASEQLGASEAVLEKTQAYALERHQFGRAIGSFQAVKHRLADMMVLNEAAKSAAWYAACAADEMPEDLPVAAATAMVVTSRALKRNSKNMIQLHGGMGFTWECEAHLYLKRAELSSRYLGAETAHRETLAAFALGETQPGETP